MAFRILIAILGLLAAARSAQDTCNNKLEYEFSVLQKLVDHVANFATLLNELKEAKQTIAELQGQGDTPDNDPAHQDIKHATGSSYVRWGRTVCPPNATLVYEGYVGGSFYDHPGAASNYLCLPSDPIWERYTDGYQTYTRIYGAEYETNYLDDWKYLHDYEVPCAVCRITRDVLMVPGRNICHKDYMLEYSGYLMAGAYSHKASSEYVCADKLPETIGDTVNNNGKLFHLVEAECGSLKCPPYVGGRELTCAVCSYSPTQ